MDLGTIVFTLLNVLTALSWFLLAYLLWRVRRYDLFNGGCRVVTATLVVFGVIRVMSLLGFRPWQIPTIMAISGGLTILSTIIIAQALYRLSLAPPKVEDPTVVVIPQEAAKLFSEIKKGGH